jgi:hypothetical protein
MGQAFNIADEVLTQQCPCLGLSIHRAYVGAWQIRRLQTEIGVHTNLPRFVPPEGKDLHPACLILYCWYNWSCYNGAQMGSGYGRKRDGVCYPMHGIYARSGVYARLAYLGDALGGFIYAAN